MRRIHGARLVTPGRVCRCVLHSRHGRCPGLGRPRTDQRHVVDAARAGIPRHRRAGLPARRRCRSPPPRRAAPRSSSRVSRPRCWRACPRPWCSTSTRPCSTTRCTRRGCCAIAPMYDARSWGEWVGAGQAEAVPGAREFIAAARRLGHTVFYISNRDCTVPPPTATDPCPAKTATMRNLVALGIDPAPGSGAHAAARRKAGMEQQPQDACAAQFIAANYRIVALVGDDLGDFVDPKVFAGDRERLEPRFGVSWFLLPNPMYGSWTNPYGTLEQKYAGLRTEAPVLELPGVGPWRDDAARVRIASWNVEYLMTPETHRGAARQLRGAGRHGGRRRPHVALRHHAARTAQRPPTTPRCATTPRRWPPTSWRCRRSTGRKRRRWCSRATTSVSPRARTRRRTASPSGAALPYRCETEYEPLSLDNAVRRGVVATFFPGTRQEFRLMSVHLKSGCPAGPLTAEGRNCDLLSRQMAPLEAWIDEQARAGTPFRPARRFQSPLHAGEGPGARCAGAPAQFLRRNRRRRSAGRETHQHHGAREVHPLHPRQRIPRIHRHHPAGTRPREDRGEEVLRAGGVQRCRRQGSLAVGSLPGGHRAASAVKSSHTSR